MYKQGQLSFDPEGFRWLRYHVVISCGPAYWYLLHSLSVLYLHQQKDKFTYVEESKCNKRYSAATASPHKQLCKACSKNGRASHQVGMSLIRSTTMHNIDQLWTERTFSIPFLLTVTFGLPCGRWSKKNTFNMRSEQVAKEWSSPVCDNTASVAFWYDCGTRTPKSSQASFIFNDAPASAKNWKTQLWWRRVRNG